MVLDKLTVSLKSTLNKITGGIFIDKNVINEIVKDIQRALLSSDVNVKLVLEISKKIKERALNEKSPTGITKKEFLIKIIYEELVQFLGGDSEQIKIEKKPFIFMLVGLFGNGKTTSAIKLSKFYKKRGKKVCCISTDTWRPAAFTQLKQGCSQLDVPVFGNPELKDPVQIFNQFKDKLYEYDIVIVDTAGRDALSDELIQELNNISSQIHSDYNLLVIGADQGQNAQKQAQTFHDTCGVNGVLITKLDGTAKGGGALSACATTGANVKFIGIGEKPDDLEIFEPKRFVSRLLGMGDIEGLLEKVQDAFKETDVEDMGKKLLKGEFNLLDLFEQMSSLKKMGSVSKIMDLIPGMSNVNIPKEALDMGEKNMDKWKFALDSMTKAELEDPSTITQERIE